MNPPTQGPQPSLHPQQQQPPQVQASGYRYRVDLRAMLLCAGFVALLTAISIRLIYVQHTLHEETVIRLQDARRPEVPIPAKRGDILDRDRRPLATTLPVATLILNRHHVPRDPAAIHNLAATLLGRSPNDFADFSAGRTETLYYELLANQLAAPLERSAEDLLQRFTDPKLKRYMDLVIQDQLDIEAVRELITHLGKLGFSCLHSRDSMTRVYVSNDLACHVLGYVYHDLKGASGIESSMNHFLAGEDGFRVYDTQERVVEETLPQDGKHVVLTLDATFQDMAEKVIDRHYRETRPHAITAIFAEPSTGEILALVNRPGFTPANGGNAEPHTRWNTAIASIYEPGSTFKIVTHGTAMDLGLVNLDSWVSCHNGHYREDGWSLRDSSRGRESASVRDVIAYSLNTGTFMVAQQIKPLAFYDHIQRFGLGQKTGIQLPAEASGLVPHPKAGWGRKRMELSRLAMGYNLNASPLQILGFMSVVCNQGNLVKPRIIRQVLSPDAEEVTAQQESEVVEGVISGTTASRLRNALIHAVETGTGKRAQVDGYVVGGKTGTAGKVINGRYINNRNVASFLGFVGTEIEPALIGIVLVDDPQNEGKRQGGTVAAPIFQEIAEAGMRHFGVRRLEVAETVDPAEDH